MKKLLTVLLGVLMVLCVCGCESKPKEPEIDYAAKSEGVLTYAEYDAVAADNTTKVVIEGYVQASQSYWGGATMYLQDPDGAYFVYTGNISEEDWGKLGMSNEFKAGWTGIANGTKLRVTGYKTEWSGEVEIGDVESVEIVDDVKWIAEPVDVTSNFDDATALLKNGNQLVTMKGLTVTKAATYNWDGSGAAGQNNDLYYSVSNGKTEYSFVVESYLMYEGSAVYDKVLSLKEGDKVDVTGFLYWYNAPQLHTVDVK